MVAEVLAGLQCRPGGLYLDGTVGLGGHAAAILAASAPDGQLVGLDRDPEALALAATRLAPFQSRWRLWQACYSEVTALWAAQQLPPPAGILLDLGLSSAQLAASGRGFSFQRDEPLDMRFDPGSSEPTAADLLNQASEAELARIFQEYGEERHARRLARRLVQVRQRRPVTTTAQLVAIIKEVIPRGAGRIHPATRVFQALRLAVNRELDRLAAFLPQAMALLAPGGRLVIITYHSLEDRLVKQALLAAERFGTWRRITKKPVRPSPEEVRANPRARSAKLRVGEKGSFATKSEEVGTPFVN